MEKIGLLIGFGCVVLALPAWGQSPVDAPAPIDTARVVITAQRRAQSPLDVPVGVSVIGSDDIRGASLTRIEDLGRVAPSLRFAEVPLQPSFSVRGVGSHVFDYSAEQSVGVVVDDVAQTFPAVPALNTLADVDRVEVLRGPQGTLFGKNTSAGVVVIVTRRPRLGVSSDETELASGNFGERRAINVTNLALGDDMAARVVAAWQTHDSAYQNLGSGALVKPRDLALTGKLLFNPARRLSLYAIAAWQDSQADPGDFSVRSFGHGTFAPGVGNNFIQVTETQLGIVPGATNNRLALGTRQFQHSRLGSGQLSATWGFDDAVLTSVTSLRHIAHAAALEPDSTPLAVTDNTAQGYGAHAFTQELRVASRNAGEIDYVGGLYFQDQVLTYAAETSGGLGFLPEGAPIRIALLGGQEHRAVLERSAAAFGDATWRMTDRLRVLGGLRLTRDKVSASEYISRIDNVCSLSVLFDGVCNPTALPTTPAGMAISRTDWSGRTGLQLDLPDRAMTYLTASRGYKGAGVTMVLGQPFAIRPETALSIEVGFKKEFLDRRASLAATVFDSRFRNFQANVYDPKLGTSGGFRTGNAEGIRSRGVELEANGTLIDGLTATGAITYVDAIYTHYRPSCFPGQTADQGCDAATSTQDVSGTRLVGAPKWSAHLGGAWRAVVSGSLKSKIGVDCSYESAVQTIEGDPATIQKGHAILNATLALGRVDDRWSLSLYGRNLFDRRYTAVIFPTIYDIGGYSQVIPYGAYRSYGVAVDWRM